MNDRERIAWVLNATPAQLTALDTIAEGRHDAGKPRSLKLLRTGEFAQMSGLSRVSVWRLCTENKIRTVELRKGSKRIPESELIRLVEGNP
jgi:hypothetical protein